jgi:tetratricopeptide (TPR) repeat protein
VIKRINLSTRRDPDNRLLTRVVLGLLAAVVLTLGAFAAYYYQDRYIAIGDQSPVERNIAHLEQMVRKNPQDAEARLSLAQYYLENAMDAKALTQARQILKAYPDSEGALFIIGVASGRSGQPQAALEPLEKLAAIRRKAPMAKIDTVLQATLYYLGENYVKLNLPEKAIAVLGEALTIDRTDADALHQLGVAYAQSGQHQLAVEQWQQAVLFVPDHTDAYRQMANSYDALAMPDYATYARAMAAYSTQDYAQARTALEQAATRLPDFPPVRLGLGLTYEHLKEFQLATQSYQRVLAVDPHNLVATYGLERIRAATGSK